MVAALAAFAQMGCGQFLHDDKCFFPENVVLGPMADHSGLLPAAGRLVVGGCAGETDITLFLVDSVVAAQARPGVGRHLCSRRAPGGLESLPDLTALPQDEDSRHIIPTSERPAGHAPLLRAIAADDIA